ncbi:MAG: putative zinc-finger [Acidimicrobiaceae bacterium]|jgi:anti-sigma factor RsiW
MEHLDELLSAHLDGELAAGERAAVEGHLAECETCRAELDATQAVRTAVRDAPPVDPPFGFYERLTATRRRRRWPAAASAVAVAAVSFAVLGVVAAPEHRSAAPPVESARASLLNTRRIEVSILPVEVDWSQLKNGLRRQIPGLPGRPWESTDPAGAKALVYETDGSTVMVVGDAPLDELEQAAREVSTSPSVVDRLRDAAGAVVSAFNWSD